MRRQYHLNFVDFHWKISQLNIDFHIFFADSKAEINQCDIIPLNLHWKSKSRIIFLFFSRSATHCRRTTTIQMKESFSWFQSRSQCTWHILKISFGAQKNTHLKHELTMKMRMSFFISCWAFAMANIASGDAFWMVFTFHPGFIWRGECDREWKQKVPFYLTHIVFSWCRFPNEIHRPTQCIHTHTLPLMLLLDAP